MGGGDLRILLDLQIGNCEHLQYSDNFVSYIEKHYIAQVSVEQMRGAKQHIDTSNHKTI